MKIKLQNIRKYLTSIEKLSAEKLPLKTAFKLAKLKKELLDQGSFYDDHYRKIIMEYAKLDEEGRPLSKDGGQTIEIKDGKIKEVNEALAELNGLEEEIGDYRFKLEDFGDIEIDVDTLGGLMEFIEE